MVDDKKKKHLLNIKRNHYK